MGVTGQDRGLPCRWGGAVPDSAARWVAVSPSAHSQDHSFFTAMDSQASNKYNKPGFASLFLQIVFETLNIPAP